MTYRSHNVGPSRAFDHIYDPLYVASDRKDVCRANHAALAKSAPIGIFPVYQSMFSELPRLTRNHYVMHCNPLPCHPEVQVSSLRAYGCGLQQQTLDTSRVLGAERAKFFCHPNAGETGCNVRYSMEHHGCAGEQDTEYCGCDYDEEGRDTGEARFREVASQTMFRESSAQTQPWMPTAVLKENVMPSAEIVYVAEMLQHTRFPGLNEVEIVERARRKRTWEYALGACESVDEWRQQKLVLQIFEWEEWVARERQIDRYQMLRLQLVAKIMEKRERSTHQASEGKMENTKRRINEARNQAVQKLEATLKRNLRKLERKRHETSVRYGSKGCQAPALEALAGGRKKYSKQSYDYDPNLIEVGLAKLEKKTTIPRKFVNPRDQRPELWKPKEVCREFQKGFWSDNFLRKLYESLKQFRNRKDSERTVPQCLIVVSSPTESIVVSPISMSPEKENDSLYQQAVLLQKLIRGRATQIMIHRDYASEHDLMEDLIASHRLPVVEEFFPVDAPAGTTATGLGGSVRERYLHILKNELLLDAFIESSSHAQMSSLMNTLERELTRLQNERNTQAFYLLAEQERYMREPSSVFESAPGFVPPDRKTQGAHDELAIYLENALMEQAENVDETREKIHQLARKFDEEADRRSDGTSLLMGCGPDLSTTGGRAELGTIVGSLADEMLLPDLFRRAARENIKYKQRNILASVHEMIYNRQDDEDDAPIDKVDQSPAADRKQPEERRVVDDLLGGIIDRAVLFPPVATAESAYSENEVEELPEDEEEMAGSDFYGLGFDGTEMCADEQEAEEQIGRMANDLIDDILSHVLDVSEEDNAAVQ